LNEYLTSRVRVVDLLDMVTAPYIENENIELPKNSQFMKRISTIRL